MLARVRELFEYQELLMNLVKKELKVKYKNSVLGFFWSLLNPLLTMLVLTFVFSFVFKPGVKHFPLFLLAGLLPWNLFSLSVQSATPSIVNGSDLIKKVYFPREILPIAIPLANLVGFFFEMVILVVLLTVFGYPFYRYIYFLPFLVIAQVAFTVGVALILASLDVYFRDVEHLVGVALLVWFWASPIVYPYEILAEKFQNSPWASIIYKTNPLASTIICYRNVLYYGQPPNLKLFAYVLLSAALALTVGYAFFSRFEPNFAEEV